MGRSARSRPLSSRAAPVMRATKPRAVPPESRCRRRAGFVAWRRGALPYVQPAPLSCGAHREDAPFLARWSWPDGSREDSLEGRGRVIPSARPRRTACVAAAVRVSTSSFARMLETWLPTVFGLIDKAAAICRSDCPSASNRSTSRSRNVRLGTSRSASLARETDETCLSTTASASVTAADIAILWPRRHTRLNVSSPRAERASDSMRSEASRIQP